MAAHTAANAAVAPAQAEYTHALRVANESAITEDMVNAQPEDDRVTFRRVAEDTFIELLEVSNQKQDELKAFELAAGNLLMDMANIQREITKLNLQTAQDPPQTRREPLQLYRQPTNEKPRRQRKPRQLVS